MNATLDHKSGGLKKGFTFKEKNLHLDLAKKKSTLNFDIKERLEEDSSQSLDVDSSESLSLGSPVMLVKSKSPTGSSGQTRGLVGFKKTTTILSSAQKMEHTSFNWKEATDAFDLARINK